MILKVSTIAATIVCALAVPALAASSVKPPVVQPTVTATARPKVPTTCMEGANGCSSVDKNKRIGMTGAVNLGPGNTPPGYIKPIKAPTRQAYCAANPFKCAGEQ